KWGKSFGGVSLDAGQAVVTDGSGNIYLAGYFMSSIDFGNGTGSLTSAGDYDMFIAKFSSAGVPLWTKRYGGTGKEFVTSIALDANGNIFVGGYFTGTTDLGKGPMASVGGLDMFIAKYDANGMPVWVKSFGTIDTDSVTGLAVD